MASPSSDQTQATARYYDRNTLSFLKNQKAHTADTIHRALYAPGVKDRHQALEYSHTLILKELLRLQSRKVLDLGCGVGATLRYLRSAHPDCLYQGITVSTLQKDLACQDSLPVDLWDYHKPQWFTEHRGFDAIYAIESLQHATDLKQVVDNIASSCVRNSRFIVIDDFLRDLPFPAEKEHILRRFRGRWHAQGFGRLDDFIRILGDRGFSLEYAQDLSAYQRSRPWLNHVLYQLYTPLDVLRTIPAYGENLLGGNALLRLQDLSLSAYYFLVFTYSGEKPPRLS